MPDIDFIYAALDLAVAGYTKEEKLQRMTGKTWAPQTLWKQHFDELIEQGNRGELIRLANIATVVGNKAPMTDNYIVRAFENGVTDDEIKRAYELLLSKADNSKVNTSDVIRMGGAAVTTDFLANRKER